MKKFSASQSAFFNPRVLIGLAFCLIGLVLAMLAFGLYPSQSALAQGPVLPSIPKESPMQSDQPPDTTPYVRPAIPADNAPGGRPALPQLKAPSALVTIVRDVVVSNTDPNLTNTDAQNDGEPSIAID